jgi:hypothetical protein
MGRDRHSASRLCDVFPSLIILFLRHSMNEPSYRSICREVQYPLLGLHMPLLAELRRRSFSVQFYYRTPGAGIVFSSRPGVHLCCLRPRIPPYPARGPNAESHAHTGRERTCTLPAELGRRRRSRPTSSGPSTQDSRCSTRGPSGAHASAVTGKQCPGPMLARVWRAGPSRRGGGEARGPERDDRRVLRVYGPGSTQQEGAEWPCLSSVHPGSLPATRPRGTASRTLCWAGRSWRPTLLELDPTAGGTSGSRNLSPPSSTPTPRASPVPTPASTLAPSGGHIDER